VVAASTDLELAKRDIVRQLKALPLSRAHFKLAWDFTSGSVVVGALTDLLRPQNAFTVSAALFGLAGLMVTLFGIETKGKPLEEIQALT
jgi:hypothetical protein